MTQRIAAILSLVAFAMCLIIGAFEAGNTFATTVSRALVAMVVTLVIGLIIGAMARVMLQENVKDEEKRLKNHSASASGEGR